MYEKWPWNSIVGFLRYRYNDTLEIAIKVFSISTTSALKGNCVYPWFFVPSYELEGPSGIIIAI